jgi:hypothetical protein
VELDAVLEGNPLQYFPDRLVGGDAAGSHQRRGCVVAKTEHLQAGAQPVMHHLHHGLLERCAKICDILVAERGDSLGFEPQRGLEPGQREVRLRPALHRARQREPGGVAARRLFLDLRPARIAQPQKLPGLVERLADGVVQCGAEQAIVADPAHRENLSVAARGEEQAIGKRRRRGEPRRQRVRLEVIDRQERLVVDQRDGLGGGQADDHATDQPGPGGRGDPVDIAKGRTGFRHGLANDAVQRFDMGARGDFRDHAAERGMFGDLGEHDIG